MQPEISSLYMLLTIPKEFWEAVWETYSKIQEAAQIYEIKEITDTKPSNLYMIEYYNIMKRL